MPVKNNPDGVSAAEIIQFLEGRILEAVMEIPQEYFSMTDTELEKHFNRSDKDFIIRRNFQRQAKIAKKTTGKISQQEIYGEVCSRQNFFYHLKNPHRLAWYLRPIEDFSDLIEEAFYFGLKRVREEILTMPITEKSASAYLKALEFFANRHLGPMVQRIEQKNLNLNASVERPEIELSPDDIKTKIKELESALDKRPVIDVTPE